MSAQDTYAAISRQQWQDYQDRFVPIENKVIGQINNPAAEADSLSRARSATTSAFDAAPGVTERTARRFGQPLDTSQQTALARRTGLARAASMVNADNQTRTSLKDLNLAAEAKMISVGRGLSQSATGGLGTVASMEQQRNAQNQQIDAQNQNQMLSTVGTLAGAVIFGL